MFTRSTGQAIFDSVLCVGASITRPPTGEQPEVQLTMVYVRGADGTTFGTCPVQTHLLSQKTLDLVKSLLESAEEDFGQLAFGEGALVEAGTSLRPGVADAPNPERKGLGWKG